MMRIRGQEVKGPNEGVIVIPRPARHEPKLDNGNPVYLKGDDGQPIMEDGKPVPETVEVSGDIVFKARAILDYAEFEALCPQPKPGMLTKRGQAPVPDNQNPKYQESLQQWAEKRTHWMVIKSLEATPDLEWSTVIPTDPNSWKNYITELRDAGFTTIEANKIVNLVATVNGLDDDKYEEARQRFLQSPEATA